MPKRKRDNDDNDDKPRRKVFGQRRATKVDIVNPRHRSRIPSGIFSEKPNKMVKLVSTAVLDSLTGDIGGSTMFFTPWKVNTPWLGGGIQQPTSYQVTPVGFTDIAAQFERYRVMGVKVDMLWTPSAISKSGSTYYDTGGQILAAEWRSGEPVTTAHSQLTLFSDPKHIKTIIDPRGVNQYHLAGTDAGSHLSHFPARKYRMKMFRKPTMDLGAERMDTLRNDVGGGWLNKTDLSSADPSSDNKWGLRIDIVPYDANGADKIYFNLRFRIKWYIEFVQGIDM